MLGDRLLTSDSVTVNGVFMCNKTLGGPIYDAYCNNETDEALCKYFEENDVVNVAGIPGLASGIVNGKESPAVSCVINPVLRSSPCSTCAACLCCCLVRGKAVLEVQTCSVGYRNGNKY